MVRLAGHLCVAVAPPFDARTLASVREWHVRACTRMPFAPPDGLFVANTVAPVESFVANECGPSHTTSALAPSKFWDLLPIVWAPPRKTKERATRSLAMAISRSTTMTTTMMMMASESTCWLGSAWLGKRHTMWPTSTLFFETTTGQTAVTAPQDGLTRTVFPSRM